MKSGRFKASERRPIRPEMTVSRPEMAGDNVFVIWFSLGADTSITPETYDVPVLYLGGAKQLCEDKEECPDFPK